MAIYQAEIVGKHTEEDRLTSRVFGALAILDKKKVVAPFLVQLTRCQPIPDGEIDSLVIKFWEYCDGCYPDVWIETDSQLIVIEVKKDSKATPDQLAKQFKATAKWAKESRKELTYLLVTNDGKKSKAVSEGQDQLKRRWPDAQIEWASWPDVREYLNSIKKEVHADTVSVRLLEDTIDLLESYGMKKPTGLDPTWLDKSMKESLQVLYKMAREVNVVIKDLDLKAAKQGLSPLNPRPFYTTKKFERDDPNSWIMEYYSFPYKDSRWKRITKADWDGAYLYVDFWPGSHVAVGFYNGKASDDQIRRTRDQLSRPTAFPGLDPYDFERPNQKLDIHYEMDREEVKGRDIADKLLDKLIKTRKFVNDSHIFTKELGLNGK